MRLTIKILNISFFIQKKIDDTDRIFPISGVDDFNCNNSFIEDHCRNMENLSTSQPRGILLEFRRYWIIPIFGCFVIIGQ